jgi:hypothetical protein
MTTDAGQVLPSQSAACGEVVAQFARPVGFAGMAQHVNQGVKLPPIGVTEGHLQAARLEPREEIDGTAELRESAFIGSADCCVQEFHTNSEEARRCLRRIAGLAPVAREEKDVKRQRTRFVATSDSIVSHASFRGHLN